ncbi:hypothetical protein CB1_001217002 [Camelus ferus]|nr:hypothetical protein CB1_001217002 [Camelus ferus]
MAAESLSETMKASFETFQQGGSGSGGSFQLITAILLSSCALALHAWQLDVRLRLDYVLASQSEFSSLTSSELLSPKALCQRGDGRILLSAEYTIIGAGSCGSWVPPLALTCRLSARFKEQGREERDNVERVKLDNKRVLFNLLPAHVTQHFLMSSPRNTVLYCQSCSQVGVMLTSIPKFNDFYIQLDDRQQRGGAVSAPPE